MILREWIMAREFKAVDRDTPMLLPPDLREWLPQDHLAYLVLSVVEQLDLSAITASYRRGGVGREAFDPAMLIGLLIYAYAQGIRSSRQIERACVTDVAMRVVAAQQRPDHTTLARFRQRHAAALADLFGQVLALCGRAGMGKVGIVAVDGTKIAGQASPRKNYDEARLRTMAADIVAEAEAADAAEDVEFGPDRSGDELPQTLRSGSDRADRIRQALDQIVAEKAAAQAADVAAAEAKLGRAQRQAGRERAWTEDRPRASGRRRRRQVPVDEQVKVQRADRRVDLVVEELARARAGQGPRASRCNPLGNISDPQSHLMFVRGKGFLQGYNAQLAVSDDHLILASDLSADTNDAPQFVSILNRAVNNVATHLDAEIGTVVADAGYCSHEALTAPGPDRLIATGRQPDRPSKTGKDPAIAQMAQRLTKNSPTAPSTSGAKSPSNP